jgi:hypothetical protein
MPLPVLNPGTQTVNFQDTSFAIDALGRLVCSTWNEATLNGGPPFTAIVVGAGMYGAYCASKVFRRSAQARILLLDAGRFLVSEHVQNLANIRLNIPGAISAASDSGIAPELVWGCPGEETWSSQGHANCTGGKSIYWGGWCLRPKEQLRCAVLRRKPVR